MQCVCMRKTKNERERIRVGVHQELGEQAEVCAEQCESLIQGREGRTVFLEEVHFCWALMSN